MNRHILSGLLAAITAGLPFGGVAAEGSDATRAVSVRRGSTTIRRAPRLRASTVAVAWVSRARLGL